MQYIPLKSLYSFVAVADTGSMTSAAAKLHVSHSAISQAIKAIETQLGLKLFERTGRSVTLTAKGREYYARVNPALQEIIDASNELRHSEQRPQLTLNMTNSLILHWWLPRVDDFQRHVTNVDMRLSSHIGEFSLKDHDVDIALVHGLPQQWPDQNLTFLAHDELVLVHRPDQQGQSINTLLANNDAIFVTNPRRLPDWPTWCEALALPLPEQRNNRSFDSTFQALQAVSLGLGILVTHTQFVTQHLNAQLLTTSGPRIANPNAAFYLATSSTPTANSVLAQACDWFHHAFSTAAK
uniref:LysR family transcriptional regulator n=1 Tax=Thaumasiovibrio occultus TaxID=1891184 RepID=UPI000B352975|nr:LysR family transcriptional regulator [Thaumasiovibrio occultus]